MGPDSCLRNDAQLERNDAHVQNGKIWKGHCSFGAISESLCAAPSRLFCLSVCPKVEGSDPFFCLSGSGGILPAAMALLLRQLSAAGGRRFSAGLAAASTRGVQTVALPDLPYDYAELEPVVSAEIMELHHAKHHQAYVNNYNVALEKYEAAEKKKDTHAMIALHGALRFNGGGHVNHCQFWENLAPEKKGGGELPQGPLADAIATQFGSLDELIKKVNAAGAAVQGSGWVWLGVNKDTGKLLVDTTPNQDPLVVKGAGLVSILGIDVWEHAYYLQYKNVRPDYLKHIWKVVNWRDVTRRYEQAMKARVAATK
ncbi:hypothetical protein CBR_g49466 [Chara braunii]|uniref:superoxide dismutase n=1 Tax=Chara braunii TaxID=69332 RepID=A0A388K579_CHABU|nr:hypothetical protein CBR_g49466 [Chara braunii]|eukprot:GBG65103.1 hypothetical protein CBR_g49466 [Chara braunii]